MEASFRSLSIAFASCIFVVSGWKFDELKVENGRCEETEIRRVGKGIAIGLRFVCYPFRLTWTGIEIVDAEYSVSLGPHLFSIGFIDSSIVTSAACRIYAFEQESAHISANFSCPYGTHVAWNVDLRPAWHFARVSVSLSANMEQMEKSSESLNPVSLTLLQAVSGQQAISSGSVGGSPVIIGDRIFFGAEHPLGQHSILSEDVTEVKSATLASILNEDATQATKTTRTTILASLTHLGSRTWPPQGGVWTYRAAIGVASERNQMRRDFMTYLDTVRPLHRRKDPLLHYNSWYDMHSWQDESFFGNDGIIHRLRLEKMTDATCLQRLQEFANELVFKRGVQMDSFLWDDGWDDPTTLWDFDRSKFPSGFHTIASASRSFGAGIGVWLSPWGGYGSAQIERLTHGVQQGFELNAGGFSLAGTKYFSRFREVAERMVQDYGINMFKFDGVAGDPGEVADEMESMLQLINALRFQADTFLHDTACMEENACQTIDDDEKNSDDPWINLTTGTWPSPYFLLWADSIWRGGLDVDIVRDEELSNLSTRQSWIVWREMQIFQNVVSKASLFPLPQLMIHGVVLGLHGEALALGLHEGTLLDFAQEIWAFVGMGLQLQELYISPELMSSASWDILADALLWSHAHNDILRDSHWVFGEFKSFEPYGVASWNEQKMCGFLMLRNPRTEEQSTRSFALAEILELPVAFQELELKTNVVRTLSQSQRENGCIFSGSRGACTVSALEQVEVRLMEAEVLIVEISA